MSWQLPVTPQHSGEPLTPEQLRPPAATWTPAAPADTYTRAEIDARAAVCRQCPHVGHGGQTCAACDIRCAHPLAAERPPLLAVPESICPAGLWPVAP